VNWINWPTTALNRSRKRLGYGKGKNEMPTAPNTPKPPPASGKKKLFLIMIPPLMLLAILALMVTIDQARPYKKFSFGNTTLYVPKLYIVEAKGDMISMVRDTIGGMVFERYQFQAYADEILPPGVLDEETLGGSSVIWTIGQSSEGAHGRLTQADAALIMGTPPFEARTISTHEPTGLIRLKKPAADARSHSFTNLNPEIRSTDAATAWVAHCIELTYMRKDSPWARCTVQTVLDGIMVQIHYDGRLVSRTDQVITSVTAIIDRWRSKPD
jgi:hypothetical protein